jgi:pimeloyl-ACP methyl ester carboxylesterase
MEINKAQGIAYKVVGDLKRGTPILLLKGLGRSMSHWVDFADLLSQVAPVILVDLRGMGASDKKLGWQDSISDYASDLVQVLDALTVPKAHIMGVSLGGMVALAFGLLEPQRTASLIVMNASIAGSRTPRLSSKAFFLLLKSLVRPAQSLHGTLAEILAGSSLTESRKKEVTAWFEAIAQKEGLYTIQVLKQLGAAARFHVRRRLPLVQVPALILCGSHDQFVPIKNSKLIHRLLPDATFKVIEGGGHELEIDYAPELLSQVREWLRMRGD